LYDKPTGVTSHDVVAVVRRTVGGGRRSRGPGRVRVGHAGTLDPFATGLLLVLVGRATRVQRFLMALPKSYSAVARFGAVSSTGDPEGEITVTGVVPSGDLELPTGSVRQRPPAYSAVKVGGRRAYALARAGETVELAERVVSVYRFDEVWRAGDRRGFEIECSSGTYVRSLIMALGDAYCEQLRRVRIGPFDAADADPERIVPLGEALGFLPEVRLDAEAARRAAHGGAVAMARSVSGATGAGEVVRLTDAHGLIALAEPRPGGMLAPVVGLRG
jgi:tRNA pseudouridine55 synthase